MLNHRNKLFTILFLACLITTLSFTLLKIPEVKSTYSGTNYEPLSAFYADMNGAASSYASLDYSVLFNGNPSIRLDNDYVRGTREVDGAYLDVSPGDHIYASVWVKTSNSQSNNQYSGGRIGIDMRGNTVSQGWTILDSIPHAYENVGGVWGSGALDGNAQIDDGLGFTPISQFQIPFGNDWTLAYWDFYVPSTNFQHNIWGTATGGG